MAAVNDVNGKIIRRKLQYDSQPGSSKQLRAENLKISNQENPACNLFPDVFTVIVKKFENPDYPAFEVANSFILQLRLVCKQWCRVIDNYFDYRIERSQLYSYQLEKAKEIDKCDLVETKKVDLEFGDAFPGFLYSFPEYPEKSNRNRSYLTRLQLFLHFFGKSHGQDTDRNPIVGRFVQFHKGKSEGSSDPDSGTVPYHDQITEFLELFGRHIWYFDISIDENFKTQAAYFKKIREWLHLMPNLKQLIWMKHGEVEPVGTRRTRLDPVNDKDLIELEAAVENESRRITSQLENLEKVSFSGMPSSFVNLFLERNKDLQKLTIAWSRIILSSTSMQLELLWELELVFHNKDDFEALEKCSQTWELEKLTLEFYSSIKRGRNSVYIPWSRIFKYVERWSGTLSDVNIWLPRTTQRKELGESQVPLSLNLPKVKRLSLTFENYSSLDFILPMKENLEWLKISYTDKTMRFPENPDASELPLLHDYNSKIWNLFPKLERISFDRGLVEPPQEYYSLRNTFSRLNWRKLKNNA